MSDARWTPGSLTAQWAASGCEIHRSSVAAGALEHNGAVLSFAVGPWRINPFRAALAGLVFGLFRPGLLLYGVNHLADAEAIS